MIDSPQITQTTAQPIAVIHLTVPRFRIREVMGPGLAELKATVAAQGIAIAGPWFTHHLKIDPDTFDFEIGPLGGLRRGPRVQSRPGHLAHGAQPVADRLAIALLRSR